MAQRTIVTKTSDLSGAETDHTTAFSFSVDGGPTYAYEIDLTDDELGDFLAKLDLYVESGRKVGAKPKRTKAARRDNDFIRAWARDNGFEVAERGRLPKNIVEAYEAQR